MKVKKMVMTFIFMVFSIFSLQGCSFEAFQNALSSIAEEADGFHKTEGNSIELINNAFNAVTDANGNSLLDDFSNINKRNDFENATRHSISKNLSNLIYNEGMTPSTGKVKGLVVPIDFPDYAISNTKYLKLYPEYQSVKSYYYNISYGKLNLEFDVMDWYRLPKESKYYASLKQKNEYDERPGIAEIIKVVLHDLQKKINLKDYDSNNDGIIDCLYLIYNHPISYVGTDDFWWAYQYYFIYNNTYNNVSPYPYIFAGFNFLFEDGKSCNARTLIHETGHLFGLEDYYDYDENVGFNQGGLGGFDMMDATAGDFNPFSKMAVGWIDDPIIPDFSESNTARITIDSFEKSGDTILIPKNNFVAKNGMFQNYYLIMLNNSSSRIIKNQFKNITKDGIRIFEVNAELETIYDTNSDFSFEYYKYDNSYTDLNIINTIINDNGSEGYYNNKIYNYLCASNNDIFDKLTDFSINNNKYSISIGNFDKDNLNATIIIKKN